jgi:hypothetical protein
MSLGNSRVRLNFPKMRVKFINKNKLDLSYENKNINSRLQETFNKISEMDDFLMNKAKEYSKEWFQRDSLEDVETMYLKQNKKNKNYDPLFRVKVVESKKGEVLTEFFNNKKESINIESYESLKGKLVDGIYEASDIWFSSFEGTEMKFGVIWNVVQMRVYEDSTELDEYSFVEETNECLFVED